MPGDVIAAEVYAKYVDPTSSNWTTALNNLMSQIAANTAGVVVDGAAYTSSTTSFPAGFAGLQSTNDTGAPRAYLNWLVFDRNYGFITGGFKQIGTTAKEAGSDVPHELLQMPAPITITQPGYVYIYLSNESASPVEVYFDDFKVTHTKSPVIHSEDYYPFGLTLNSYQRENTTPQEYKYNGKELQDELSLNWLDYGARMYQSELGRFFTQDAFAEKYYPLNPYQYAANNPVGLVDINGDSIWFTQNKGIWTLHYTGKVLNLTDGTAPNAEDYVKKFKEAFSFIQGFELDIQFSDAASINDVTKSDHLIAIVDEIEDAEGVTGQYGSMGEKFGKISYVEGSSNSGKVLRSMVHEGGHQLGLSHNWNTTDLSDDHPTNMMGRHTQYFGMSILPDRRDRFVQNQAQTMLSQWRNGNVGAGRNSSRAPADDPGSSMPLWFFNLYHSSSPKKPYKEAVQKGDKIPTYFKPK
ncbi:MAG: RHS repeat-associated core domain-containing protein [Cyclobacteriaceae bacterium]|nr:RHS repeat-associated core domain-containing protein [Cyclobacteriaceae bacterium]